MNRSHTFWKRVSAAIILVLPLCFRQALSYKVLFFNGMGEGSHYIAASGLAEELSGRGHSVTFLLGTEFKHRAENTMHKDMFNFIFVHTNASTKEIFQYATVEAFKGNYVFYDMEFLAKYGKDLADQCEAVFNTTVLNELRSADFDLIVSDAIFPCTVVLGEYINLETVVLSTISVAASIFRAVGGIINPAVTTEFGSGFPEKMTFLQRCNNLIRCITGDVALSIFAESPYQHIFKPLGVRGYMESLHQINLYITQTDPVFDQKVPMMPGHIYASGLTIKETRPLTKELEEFMQSAGDDGVIIFSLGTFVTHMPNKFVTMFLDAFSNLRQKVLWQWKNIDDPPKNMPKNVKLMKWIPQLDVLGHNQTKLLFYQGGNNGVYEAIYHAVPVLVMPLIADQPDVAQRVVDRGIGLRIDIPEMTSDLIAERITIILTDHKFKDKVSRLSAIFRDRAQNPRERAAFMIEHILKHGSDHLRSPTHDLNYAQFLMLDVILFFAVLAICCTFTLYQILRILLKYIFRISCSSKVKSE